MLNRDRRWWLRASMLALSAMALCVSVYAFALARPASPDPMVQLADEDWPAHGRDAAETRYSPLKQIDTTNVGQLELAWSWTIPMRGARVEATPIVSGGVLYGTGPMSLVFALDARTGREKWRWDPMIPSPFDGGPRACCGYVNRGVALEGNRVFVGLLDGRLVALDKNDGSVIWSVQTTPAGTDYSITGAPRVVLGKVIIGNAGAEYGVRGYVSAYDAATGRQLWRTYTVPGNPALGFESEALRRAAATWTGEWWKIGGGGTVWDAMAWDPETRLLYVGTGNGSPWSRDHRSPGGGDNLYLSSILALDPDNGEIVWHYQTTPGDDWDFTATQHLMLLDLEIGGRQRKVIVQAPKNGFFYVLDRRTGEFISAKRFADDVNWASGIDPKSGRPIETSVARYGSYPEGIYVSPGPLGAHSWYPMSWSPRTGLVYIPAENNSYLYRKSRQFFYRLGSWNTGTDLGDEKRVPRPALKGPPLLLLGWDPSTNREVWRAAADGTHGGTLATGGDLVFWGSGRRLLVINARTGKQLWTAPLAPLPGVPVTYAIDGRQYVTIAAGPGDWAAWPRIMTFALPLPRR